MALSKDKINEFVDAYFANRMNASRAAAELGYPHPKEQGYVMRRNPRVAEVIKERLRQSAMDADEVIAMIADIARDADFNSDRLSALNTLAKHHGLLIERQRIEATVDSLSELRTLLSSGVKGNG
jgi:hypothetical protein